MSQYTKLPHRCIFIYIKRHNADVVVGINLHLLSLSTGNPHPLAHTPLISVDYNGRDGHLGVRADISRETLGFMAYLEFFEGISELWVWDWKHGRLRLVSTEEHDLESKLITSKNAYSNEDSDNLENLVTESMTFHILDHKRILLPIIVEEGGEEVARAALYILDCSHEYPYRSAFDKCPRLATLYLPHLAEQADYVQFYCVANTPSPSSGFESFTPDPSLRVVAFQIGISADPLQRPTYFYLFVQAETLLHYCSRTGADAIVVEWEDWGPDACLIAKPGDPEIWLVDEVCHKRCLVMERNKGSDEDAPMAIMVYDFSPRPVLRYDSASKERQGKWEFYFESHALEDRTLWRSGVVKSGLPFRKIDTGFLAHPIDVPEDTKEHALTGNFYLTCNNM